MAATRSALAAGREEGLAARERTRDLGEGRNGWRAMNRKRAEEDG